MSPDLDLIWEIWSTILLIIKALIEFELVTLSNPIMYN